MLKAPENTQPPKTEAINYETNLNNIDELLGELSQPVQDFTPKAEAAPEPGIYDPVTNDFGSEQEPMTPEQSARSGRRTALFFDGLLSMGAMTVAKAESREPYKASSGDMNDIGEAWADYSKEHPFDLPPYATLAMLYLTVYLPKITKAFNDRRINELDDRITNLEKKEDDAV